ncbi:MAG: hypothetical protein WA709_00615 [Stellaceae bacterium]
MFLLRMVAAKNSRNRRAAWSPAPAMTAGMANVLPTSPPLTGIEASTTADTLRR